jgi:hypothetical protein
MQLLFLDIAANDVSIRATRLLAQPIDRSSKQASNEINAHKAASTDKPKLMVDKGNGVKVVQNGIQSDLKVCGKNRITKMSESSLGLPEEVGIELWKPMIRASYRHNERVSCNRVHINVY